MKKQIINLVDDLDGTPAHETVTFTYDGVAYTIDLSKKNATKLRSILTPYQQAGTRTRRPRGPRLEDTPAGLRRIRSWAYDQGRFETVVRDGRITREVLEAFYAAPHRKLHRN